jgi:hypothetical protein
MSEQAGFTWEKFGARVNSPWLCYFTGGLLVGRIEEAVFEIADGDWVQSEPPKWHANLEGELPFKDLGEFGSRHEAQQIVEESAKKAVPPL